MKIAFGDMKLVAAVHTVEGKYVCYSTKHHTTTHRLKVAFDITE